MKTILLGSGLLIIVAGVWYLSSTLSVSKEFTSENHAQHFVSRSLNGPLLLFKDDVGRFPSTEEGLAVLVKPTAELEGTWKGPYVEETPVDPWNRKYQYRSPGLHNPQLYDLWALGLDEDDSKDDIGNW